MSVLGPVPSGLLPLGFPSGVNWSDLAGLFATAVSMFLVIIAQSAATSRAYAVKYQQRFDENNDLVGLGVANLAAGLSSTFVVNGAVVSDHLRQELDRFGVTDRIGENHIFATLDDVQAAFRAA